MSVKSERLVNLTIALLETRRPLTFEELRRRTGYYAQSDRESARRMFERDKDVLRALGVPVEVRERGIDGELGYLIDRRRYEAPDIELDAQEVAALALALEVTGATDASLALAKVAARSPDPARLTVEPAARIDLPAEPIASVAEAVLRRIPLRFAYRTADGRSGPRTVDPYAVVRRRRAWYLVGRDHDRDALRAFRLDRIEGRTTAAGEAGGYDLPEEVDVLAVVTGPEQPPITADVAVGAGARWAVALRGGVAVDEAPAGSDVLRVTGLDPLRDRAWLLGLAPDAVVVGPEGLVAELTAALERVVAAHVAAVGAPRGDG